VESITSSSAHLNRLVENLIEISQLDSGEIRFEPSELQLSRVVTEAVRTITPVAETKEVSVVVHGTGGLVLANEDKLAIALVNILDNAVKYSPPGGEIEIELCPATAGKVAFTVRDRGPGFGEGQNLLQRFAQGAPSPYSQQRGFGLGLFIVKNYLDRVGGTVAVSDHPQGGGLVTCTVPAVPG
jgi:signal transduction histidine kinase